MSYIQTVFIKTMNNKRLVSKNFTSLRNSSTAVKLWWWWCLSVQFNLSSINKLV